MTLAEIEDDQIKQAISELCGDEIDAEAYRATFFQYLRLCQLLNIQFKVCLSDTSTQCLSCMTFCHVGFSRFRCSCYRFKFSMLQDCNCDCSYGRVLCMCDDIPQMCYDLDILADYVSMLQRSFETMFQTGQLIFLEPVMILLISQNLPVAWEQMYSTLIPLSQYEPP